MNESICVTTTFVLAAMPSLLPAYLIALVVGGGFLLFAVLLGGDADGGADIGGADVDVDLDLGADADIDADLGADHGAGLSQWFSMQFLIYFAALFGTVGTVLTLMTAMSPGVVAALAFGGGIVGGQVVHQTLRVLRSTSGNSALRPEDYINRSARVTVAVEPGCQGEVAFSAGGGQRFVAAVGHHDDEAFATGDQVFVLKYGQGRAEIVSRKEFEFLQDGKDA